MLLAVVAHFVKALTLLCAGGLCMIKCRVCKLYYLFANCKQKVEDEEEEVAVLKKNKQTSSLSLWYLTAGA